MPKYLSGRVKRTPQGSLTTDRYQYLGLDQAEPNLGDPLNPLPNAPGGSQFQIISVREKPGERFWIPLTGGIQPGSITVREEGTVVPPSGINSTTDVNFKGAAITVTGFTQDNGFPGTAVTVTVAPPGDDHGVLFNNAGEFATSPYFTFDNTTGIGSVGIGTTSPTQNLHVVGNVKLDKTIYGEDNEPGSTGDLLVKTATGGVVWTNQNSVEAGAGGTIGQIQFHGSTGLVDGADKFYYDFNNDRVGIGSTIPDRLLDVLGNSRFTGVTTFVGFTTFTDDVTFTTANAKNIFFDKSDDSLKFGDQVGAKFGDDQDLEIYHNNNNSIIANGTGILSIRGNDIRLQKADGTKTMLTAANGGAVGLYFNDTKKFETTDTGVDVSGTFYVSGISTFVDDVRITGVGNTAVVSIGKTDNLRLIHNSTNGVIENNYGELVLDGKGGGAIVFKTSVSQVERLRIHSDGKVQINGDDVSDIFSGANDLIIGETTQSSEKGITIANNSTGSIRFNDGSDAGIIDYVHPYDLMKFSTDGTERLTIDGSGSVNITGITTVGSSLTVGSNLEVNGNILPKTHKGGNIGESGSFSWNKIYADEFIGQIQTTQENLEVNNLKVTGVSTFVGLSTFGNGIHVQSGVSTFSESVGILTDLYVTGIATFSNSEGISVDSKIVHTGDTNTSLTFNNNYVTLVADGVTRISAQTTGSYQGVVLAGSVTNNGDTIFNGNIKVTGISTLSGQVGIESNLFVTGISTLSGEVGIGSNLSVAGISTFNDDIFVGTGATVGFGSTVFFGDDVKLKFGSTDGLEIYHSQNLEGTNDSYIDSSARNLYIRLNTETDNGGNIALQAKKDEHGVLIEDDGPVKLYFDGNQKLTTTEEGVTVTGLTDTGTLLVSGISTLSGEVGIGSNLSVAGISTFNDDVEFYGEAGISSIRFDKSTGSLKFITGAKAVFGADGSNTKDLEIYHDGFNSYIKETGTGDLKIQSDEVVIEDENGANSAKFDTDGGVELSWRGASNSGIKLQTTTNGVDITGNLLRTGTGQDIGALSTPWNKIYATEFIGQVNTTQENLITGQLKVTGLSTFMDDARFEKDVLILGTLTYDDVTNIDSVGLVTARSGVRINQGGLVVKAGVSTFSDKVEINSALSVTGIATFHSNVGIGTSIPNPSSKLDVRGEVWVGGNAEPVLRWRDGDNEYATARIKSGDLTFETRESGTDYERLRISESGDILMGGLTSKSSTSTAILSIEGGDDNIGIINVHAGSGEDAGELAGISFSHGGSANTTSRAKAAIALRAIGSYGKGDLCFYVDSASDNNAVSAADEKLRITSTGEVNIGGNYTQTTYKMRVTGTVAATHFDSLSDLKLKTNVKQIQNPIDTVKKIDGVTFNWKEDNDPSMGVIAQNVEEILPEIVSGDDVKSVNYSGLIGLLIETVKDQQKQIDELRGLIDK